MGNQPLTTLFEHAEFPTLPIPDDLTTAYGGDLGFTRPCLFANFGESVEGVVALSAPPEWGGVVSGGNAGDRFVMGLLRACAAAVMVGAGTFRKAGAHLWWHGVIHPGGAASFAETRRRLGLA